MKVVNLEADEHVATQSLLPWYVTDRLEPEDKAQVAAHLAVCARCRGELDVERRLRAANAVPGPAGDVERSLTRMRKRIDAVAKPRRDGAVPWLRWIVGAQFAVIALLAVLLVLPHAEVYHALGSASSAAAPNAVVMFRPEATEAEIRSALRASGARLVGGPTTTHAYLLRVAAQDPALALARLRAERAVSLAEALDPAAAP